MKRSATAKRNNEKYEKVLSLVENGMTAKKACARIKMGTNAYYSRVARYKRNEVLNKASDGFEVPNKPGHLGNGEIHRLRQRVKFQGEVIAAQAKTIAAFGLMEGV